MDVPYNKDITYIAKTHFRNEDKIFGIKKKDRRQHMYVLGKSGTGKSALLYNMIIQNIANGEGVCVVDPHGELVEDVLRAIPEDRLNDVIYFNPADTEYHIGFNVLEVEDPKYKHLVASGLMGIFTKIWANTWSARMEYIMNNAILALLDTPGTTLLGIQRILVDKDYRQQIINNLKDPVVKTFWIHEYEAWQEKFRNEAIAPIQNKVGQFLSTSIIRNVVGQGKSTIDIFGIMNTGKIFLVNVSKGRIGEDNSALLGGMLITKIQLAAMERVRIPEPERLDFYLYVDEFQNFVTDSFASILSEARKYRLNLIIAHQYTAQLKTDSGDAVRDAVFGNVGTMLIFRVGADDADFLEKEFAPEFLPEDILAQPNYHVYLKLMVDGITSRPFSAFTLPPMRIDAAADSKEKVIENSRRLYTKKKEDIEKEINDWSGLMGTRETKAPEGKWKATCSTCGKEVSVPFEPEAGRPVYCKDCMQKIKDGTLKPVKNFKMNPRKQIEANDALAALGIEFNQPNSAPQRFDRPEVKAEARHVPGTAIKNEYAKPPVQTVSERKPAEKFVHGPRKSPDKEDLGKVLAEALRDAGKNFPSKNQADTKNDVDAVKKEGTISLASLKTGGGAPIASTFSKKEQSEENKDELRKALAGATHRHDKEHKHKDAPIQEPEIMEAIAAEDRLFKDSEADTVEEVHSLIDEEQARQEKERKEREEREKEEAQKKRLLEEKERKEREDLRRQQAEARAREEQIKKERAQKEKEEQEKREREAAEKKRQEEAKKAEEDRQAEDWLRKQKEMRHDEPEVAPMQAQASEPEDKPIQQKEEIPEQPVPKPEKKNKKEVPEDLLRQILE